MPVLENPKYERFAQELAKGKTADEAYAKAGYRANRGNAATLKANQSISGRVEEIMERKAVRAEVTVQSLTDMLRDDRELARQLGQAAAAKSCVDSIAKLHGLIIDKSEVRVGDFGRLSDDELDRFIEERERAAGLCAGRARSTETSTGARGSRRTH